MAAGMTGNVPLELQQGLKYHSDDLSSGIDKVLAKYGSLIEKHRGRLSARLVAARIWIESKGYPGTTAKAQTWHCNSGDIYGSEIGLLQLSPCSREDFGLTAAQAKDPETNIKYGCKLWNRWTDNFFVAMGGTPRDRDMWAWLVTAVGPGAVRVLYKLAGGYSMSKLLSAAGNASLMKQYSSSWGSQSPALVAWRVGVAISAVKAASGGGIGRVMIAAAGGYLLMRFFVGRI